MKRDQVGKDELKDEKRGWELRYMKPGVQSWDKCVWGINEMRNSQRHGNSTAEHAGVTRKGR